MKQQVKAGFGIKVCGLLLAAQALAAISRAENIRWGPFNMTVGMQAGVEYESNANTSEHDPKDSFSLTLGPTLSGALVLPVMMPGGEQLSLTMSLGYTYKWALWGPTEDDFGAPITVALVLPMRIEHWVVVVADSFNFTNDPLESTYAANRSSVPQYNNTASASGTRQFGRLSLTLAAQRTDEIAPDDPDQEQTVYTFSVTPGYNIRETLSVFVRNTFGLTFPEAKTEQDTQGWSSELGLSGQITTYLNGSVSVGYAHAHLEKKTAHVNSGGIFGGIFDTDTIAADNVDGITSTLALSYAHPLRPNTTYSISAFRSPGVTAVLDNSNITEIYGVNLNVQHRLSSSVTLSPSIQWTHLKDAGPTETEAGRPIGDNEVADILTVQIGLTRVLSSHLSANFSYLYQTRSSNIADSSYDDHRISMYFNYTL